MGRAILANPSMTINSNRYIKVWINIEKIPCFYWDWTPKSKTWYNKIRLLFPFCYLVYILTLVWSSCIIHDLGVLGVA